MTPDNICGFNPGFLGPGSFLTPCFLCDPVLEQLQQEVTSFVGSTVSKASGIEKDSTSSNPTLAQLLGPKCLCPAAGAQATATMIQPLGQEKAVFSVSPTLFRVDHF